MHSDESSVNVSFSVRPQAFGSLLLWSVNKVPRRKDISNDLREAAVAAHQSGKGYKVISKQFGVHQSTVRKIIIHVWKTFKTVANHPGVDIPGVSPQGRAVQCTEELRKTRELHLRLHRPHLAC